MATERSGLSSPASHWLSLPGLQSLMSLQSDVTWGWNHLKVQLGCISKMVHSHSWQLITVTWQLSWGCPPESLWRVFTCGSGFSQHAADLSRSRHSKVPRQKLQGLLPRLGNPEWSFCHILSISQVTKANLETKVGNETAPQM